MGSKNSTTASSRLRFSMITTLFVNTPLKAKNRFLKCRCKIVNRIQQNVLSFGVLYRRYTLTISIFLHKTDKVQLMLSEAAKDTV